MTSTSECVLGIIPARSGSKGLKKKNIQLLGGKPLIAWSIEAALESPLVDRLIVSTDDPEFAAIAREHGADAPFLRPNGISGDTSTVEETLIHTIDWVHENDDKNYGVILLLQVTDVFRNRSIVTEVIQTLLDDPALDSVFAAKPDFKNYWTLQDSSFVQICDHGHIPRQQRQPIFREDTGVALATRIGVIRHGTRIGKNVKILSHENPGDFIDIHTEYDLWLANVLLDQRGIIPNLL